MADSSLSELDGHRPPMGYLFGDGDTVVKVGPDHRKYYIDKTILTRHSAFFAKALEGPWREAQERAITLEDIEPAIFNIHAHWLYNQELPSALDPEDWNAIMEVSSSTEQEDMIAKMKAYILADRFLDMDLKNLMIKIIVEQIDHSSGQLYEMDEYVTWAFDNIPANRPLLQLLVNDCCEYWADPCPDEVNVRVLKQMPLEFTYRTTLRFRELAHRFARSHKEACYLEHTSKEELEACGKPYHVHYEEEEDYGYLWTLRDMLLQFR